MNADDIDEIAVERACRGERLILNRAEVRVAFRTLNDRGRSANDIARLLGVSPRTVERWRSGQAFPSSLPRGKGHGGLRNHSGNDTAVAS